jgi:transposase
VARTLSAERAARILRAIRPKGASARLRQRLASEVLRDVRTLDRKIADLNGRIEAEVEASGTTLTQIFGVGPILAARIIGTVGDVGRFPTKAHFASYSGTAPLEASSGEVVRHRLSLGGNRKLSYALHMVATCQARSDARGGTYYHKTTKAAVPDPALSPGSERFRRPSCWLSLVGFSCSRSWPDSGGFWCICCGRTGGFWCAWRQWRQRSQKAVAS